MLSLSSSLRNESQAEKYKDLRALLRLLTNICSKDLVSFVLLHPILCVIWPKFPTQLIDTVDNCRLAFCLIAMVKVRQILQRYTLHSWCFCNFVSFIKKVYVVSFMLSVRLLGLGWNHQLKTPEHWLLMPSLANSFVLFLTTKPWRYRFVNQYKGQTVILPHTLGLNFGASPCFKLIRCCILLAGCIFQPRKKT